MMPREAKTKRKVEVEFDEFADLLETINMHMESRPIHTPVPDTAYNWNHSVEKIKLRFSIELAEDMWDNWDMSGKETFITFCKNSLRKRDQEARHDPLSHMIKIDSKLDLAFSQVVKRGSDGRMTKEQIAELAYDLHKKVPNALTFLADAFVGMDEMTSQTTNDSISNVRRLSQRQRFKELVSACEPYLHHLLFERINKSHLFELKLVLSEEALNRSYRKCLRNFCLPPIPRYNLLRESSEGYSKVIALINVEAQKLPVEITYQRLCALIGQFELDLKRVVDLILEAMRFSKTPSYFLSILRDFHVDSKTIRGICLMKMNNIEGRMEYIFTPIPLLIKNGFFTLEEFMSWLGPHDDEMHNKWNERIEKARDFARKAMIVTINKDKAPKLSELSDSDDIMNDVYPKHEFCAALIRMNEWELAKEVLNRYPPFSLMSNIYLSSIMIVYVNFLIDPLYKKLYISSGKNCESVSYYPYIAGKHPQIFTFEDFEANLDKLFQLGPYIHNNAVLYTRIVRIIKTYLNDSKDKSNKSLYWQIPTILDEVLLPALSLVDSPLHLSEELWSLLKLLPYPTRFSLYTSWKSDDAALIHPVLLEKKVVTIKKVKDVMKRLAKGGDNTKSKTIEDISHSMPGIVLDYMLTQIQLFDNLIEPVVESLKNLTNLSYDVLGHSMLDALSPSIETASPVMLLPTRPRMKHDGMTVAQWIQNIGDFASVVYKKYNIDLHPLLQYIANQLKAKSSIDLIILIKIVKSMTGVEVFENFNRNQIEALGGGELLYDTVKLKTDKEFRSKRKTIKILLDAVSCDELLVALPLLIATQKDGIIFDENYNNSHMKLLSSLYDQCQETLIQFGTFLSKSLTFDEQIAKFPSISQLILEYHIPMEVAIFFWRPFFTKMIENKIKDNKKTELNRMPLESKSLVIAQRNNRYAVASELIFAPIINVVKTIMNPAVFEELSEEFCTMFWTLSLPDIYVPTEMYSKGILNIKRASNAAADNKDYGVIKRKQEVDKFSAMALALFDEQNKRKEHFERVLFSLKLGKDKWFKKECNEPGAFKCELMITTLLQTCIYPRIFFHAEDAVFTAHFMYLIHMMKTVNFPTLIIIDRILCDLSPVVNQCTENEADRLGRFLCIFLEITLKWHHSKTVYDHECGRMPGFRTKLKKASDSIQYLEYENYRHICHKWQYKLTKGFIALMETTQYVSIRNSITVMLRILPVFPKVTYLAQAMEKWVERVRVDEKDVRPDLFNLTTGYLGKLKEIWPGLIEEPDFHITTKKNDVKPF